MIEEKEVREILQREFHEINCEFGKRSNPNDIYRT
jgi:hypothetical protein